MKKTKALQIMSILDKEYPSHIAPLLHESAYQLLVAVILSAQCTDARVNMVTPGLFELAPDARKMLALGQRGLIGHIRSCGYFNAKSDNILRMSKMLLSEYSGEVPATLEELTKLPGVGVKTASCILTQWFKKPGIAVDTHYFRVANRIGLVPGRSADAVYKKSLELLPIGTKVNGHEVWLDGSLSVTLHGRYTCVARKPKCGECVVYDLCEWENKDSSLEES
jgi:endonuclease III